MRVLQVLPALDSGGVERGTVDFARHLAGHGHESLVMSNGGRMVERLEREGSRHIAFPVHRKSLWSLRHVRPLRALLRELQPDLIHVRSRMPAWLVWLALKKLPAAERPALVSTFHGLYSTNAYSAIMGCGDRVIAISECVRDYILHNYPKVDPGKITVVHRGVDTAEFNPGRGADQAWRNAFFERYPQARDKALVLMPGRLSPWKGQRQFIDLMRGLCDTGLPVHGLIVGEPTPGKDEYLRELQQQVSDQGLQGDISFLGHRSDMVDIYSVCALTCNLSQHPEPFGRTVIESLAMGVPVVAFNVGGPAESLRDCLPQGLVAQNDMAGLLAASRELLDNSQPIVLPEAFTLKVQAERTLAIYSGLLQGLVD